MPNPETDAIHRAWFEPDGSTEQEAGAAIEQMYGLMIGWIEETLSK